MDYRRETPYKGKRSVVWVYGELSQQRGLRINSIETQTMERENVSQDGIEIDDCPGIILEENTDSSIENTGKRRRRPKRILHFSDGDMIEYSSEDEGDAPKVETPVTNVNPKSLNWVPWAWYQTVWMSSKLLHGCDYMGEALADFLGITSPKYQFEIDEYKRMQAMNREESHMQDVEMGAWNGRNQNNLITDSKVADV